MKIYNIARVVDGVVVNLEIGDKEWISSNTDENTKMISYSEKNVVHIGSIWNGSEFVDPSPDQIDMVIETINKSDPTK